MTKLGPSASNASKVGVAVASSTDSSGRIPFRFQQQPSRHPVCKGLQGRRRKIIILRPLVRLGNCSFPFSFFSVAKSLIFGFSATPCAEVNRSQDRPTTPATAHDHVSTASLAREKGLVPIGGLLEHFSPPGTLHVTVDTPPVSSLHSPNLPITASPAVTQDYSTVVENTPRPNPAIVAPIAEETHHDRVEVAFFLRHFADLGGQWMDICTGQRSYFSQYIIQLSSQSPLIRYSACAMAAKQLGQMKDLNQATEVTRRSSISASSMLRSSIDFEWYGAKYYEKAILLMARQISHDHSIVENHLSPGEIYCSPGSDSNHLDDHETTSSAFRIIAACILSSYEELNATMRAWTSHLDGISKLFRPHLELAVDLDNFYRVPQSLRALKASFWYFALNDMLNSCEYLMEYLLRIKLLTHLQQ